MRNFRANVTVDLNRPMDHALSKSKFAVFNSGIVAAPTYRRDEAALRATRPESVRIDIGWGAEWMGHRREIARRVDGGMVHDFTELDAIGSFLTDLGIRPYWSYCYVPAPYRPSGGDWRDLGTETSGWVDMVTAYIGQARDNGTGVGYHEVYNEPDLRDEKTGEAVFYGGDLHSYLDLYRAASTAIREADPITPIGGPALASVFHSEHWIAAFLDAVLTENLPLDFFSFHHYGTHSASTAVNIVLRQLDRRPALADVAVHLNEYNSYPVDYPRGGAQDGHHLAAAMLADFHHFLATPGLTKVSWAQMLDSGHGNYSGLVDIDGNLKPAFTAYRFYQDMPTDRRRLTVDGPAELGGLAGGDAGRAAILLWNRASRDVSATVGVTGGGPATLRRLDARHDGTTAETLPAVGPWDLDMPVGGVVLIELGDPAGVPGTRAGTVTRVRQHHPARLAAAWADLEEATTTFRLGTADSPDAVPVITADLTGCRDRITAHSTLTGPSAGHALTLRIEGHGGAAEIPLSAGATEVDLAAVAGGPDLSVAVSLTGAAPGCFATVRLS